MSSAPVEVLRTDLTYIAKSDTSYAQAVRGGSYFVIDGGDKQIDAVQLTMGKGEVKIPVISFSVEETFDPQPLEMNFTATLLDKDNDSASDAFTITLDGFMVV